MTHRTDYDILVCGARCAGAATAMLLARQGARVLVVDKSAYGSDALSTHAILRGGVWQLSRWGVLDRIAASGAPPIRRTTFHYGAESVVIDMKATAEVPALYAPRRYVFDRILVDAARDAGAEVRFGVRVEELVRDGNGRVTGAVVREGGRRRSISAGLVIGADGMSSTIAREARALTLRDSENATASVFGWVSGLANDGYHWYFERGVGAGLIPTHGGHCVFAICPPERLAEAGRNAERLFAEILEACSPELARSVAAARRTDALRRFRGLPGYIRQSFGAGWALVGDAGYFKDPFTAHGMTDALRDAELLATAIARGSDAALAGYQRERDRLSLAFFDVTQRIASFDWTVAELKDLHLELHAATRPELDAIAARSSGQRSAA